MNERNYQRELDRIIEQNKKDGKTPRLLLHACCAPCSSYCLEYLSQFFSITVLFYNPNIYPEDEYQKRAAEVRRLISELDAKNEISLTVCDFMPEEFYTAVKGLEDCREGGERCKKCFELRLRRAAAYAKENKFDFFTTTLTISPLKDAQAINEIGEKVGDEFKIRHLPSDFKKKGGYQRSIVLSKEHGLYRQDYCGCVFSLRRDYVPKNRNGEK